MQYIKGIIATLLCIFGLGRATAMPRPQSTEGLRQRVHVELRNLGPQERAILERLAYHQVQIAKRLAVFSALSGIVLAGFAVLLRHIASDPRCSTACRIFAAIPTALISIDALHHFNNVDFFWDQSREAATRIQQHA